MSYSRVLPLLLALRAVLCGQNALTTTVQGRVFSAKGNPVSGATVTISASSASATPNQANETGAPTAPGQGTYVAVTGSGPDTGHYSVSGIPSGAYDITVTYGRRHPNERKGVVLSGAQQQVDFVLDAPCDSCGSAGQDGWRKSTEAWLTVAVVFLFVINIWAVRLEQYSLAQPRTLNRGDRQGSRAVQDRDGT